MRQVLLALAAIAFVVLAVTLVLQISVAGVFRDARPSIALAWSPFDARARAQLAARLVGPNPSEDVRATAKGLAVDALRRGMLEPLALRALGVSLNSRHAGERPRIASLMFASHLVSRRDQLTQLWLIDYYRQRNDWAGMLRHFDIALRTSNTNRATLFPIMAALTSYPEVKPRLAVMLADKPIWALPFAAHLIDEGRNLSATTDLIVPILDPAVPEELGLTRSLLIRLTTAQRYDLAWVAYEATMRKQGQRASAGLRNANFEQTDGFTPFDWILAQDDELWAARERRPGTSGHALRLSVGSAGSGEAARQLVRLSPGRYRLLAYAGDIAEQDAARPVLRVICATTGNPSPLLSARPATAGTGPLRYGGDFTVPRSCRFQWVSLVLASDGSGRTISPWIDDISVIAQPRG